MGYVGSLVLIAVSTALINNVVFHYFVGNCPFIGVSRRVGTAVGMGAAVTFVTTLAALLSWTVTYFVLVPRVDAATGQAASAPLTRWVLRLVSGPSAPVVDLSILGYMVYIFLIAAAVQLVEMYVRKFFPPLYRAFGVYLPLITTNCVILFVCLEVSKHVAGGPAFWGLDKTLAYSFFAGVGFLLAILIMSGIREELDHSDVPRPLRGAGITLIIAGILSLAFMGFTGVDASLNKLMGNVEVMPARLEASVPSGRPGQAPPRPATGAGVRDDHDRAADNRGRRDDAGPGAAGGLRAGLGEPPLPRRG